LRAAVERRTRHHVAPVDLRLRTGCGDNAAMHAASVRLLSTCLWRWRKPAA
jgi:hypothetical protein